MAIVENITTEIGDVLYISAEVPIVGIITLSDFVDSVTGQTSERFFYKEFQYSTDGITFSPWLELTDINIAAINVNVSDTFIVQYRYTRQGTDPSDDLSFNSVTLEGTFQPQVCGSAFQNSIFAQFFSCQDINVLGWAINVLEKCYKNGIVPQYIERGINPTDDRDYIDFFRTFTTFFAYIVIYARQFENFGQIAELLLDNLIQRGMFIPYDTTDLQELLYLKENFYQEFSKRGTLSMIRTKDSVKTYQKVSVNLIPDFDFNSLGFWKNGNSPSSSSYIFITPGWTSNNYPDYLSSDNVLTIGQVYTLTLTISALGAGAQYIYTGNGTNITPSNMIQGTFPYTITFNFTADSTYFYFAFTLGTTITYCSIVNVVNFTTPPSEVDGELLRLVNKKITDEFIFCLLEPKNQGWNIDNSSPLWRGNNSQQYINKSWQESRDFISLNGIPVFGAANIVSDGNKSVLQITANTSNVRNGLGIDYLNISGFDFNNAIIISPNINYKITFQVRQPNQLLPCFDFGVLCFDSSNNLINCIQIVSGLPSNFFFQSKKLNKTNTYYRVEGILYNASNNLLSLVDGTCNIGFGQDLKIGSNSVCKIVPFIITETGTSFSGDGSLNIWDFKLLPYDTIYSSGIIQSTNLIKMWYKNNNSFLQNIDVESEIRRYMIPYNSYLSSVEVTN